MSIVNLPQDGPIFIPGESPSDPAQLILPFEGAGIDMPSSDGSSFEKATGLVINIADWQVDSINAVLKDDPNLLSKPTSTVLKVLGKIATIVDIGLIGFKTNQAYQEGENWKKVLAEESGASIVGWALSGAMVIGTGLAFGAAVPVTILAGLGALVVGGAYTLSGFDNGVKGIIGSFFDDDPSGGHSDLSLDFGFEIPDDYLTQEVLDTLLGPAVVTADVLNSLTTPEGGFLASVSQLEKKTFDPANNLVGLEVFSPRPDPEGQAIPGLDNQDGSLDYGQVASNGHYQVIVNADGSMTITFINVNQQETQLELTATFIAKSRGNLLNTLDDFIAAIQFDAELKVSTAELDRMITEDLQNSGMTREDLKQSIFVGVQDILRTMGPGQTPVLPPTFQDVVLPTIFTPLETLPNGDMVGYRGELISGTGSGGVSAKYHVIKTVYTDHVEVAGSEPGTIDRIP